MGHPWYLTPELVNFALWDPKISISVKLQMRNRVRAINHPSEFDIVLPLLPSKPKLSNLIGENFHFLSTFKFEVLNVGMRLGLGLPKLHPKKHIEEVTRTTAHHDLSN